MKIRMEKKQTETVEISEEVATEIALARIEEVIVKNLIKGGDYFESFSLRNLSIVDDSLYNTIVEKDCHGKDLQRRYYIKKLSVREQSLFKACKKVCDLLEDS